MDKMTKGDNPVVGILERTTQRWKNLLPKQIPSFKNNYIHVLESHLLFPKVAFFLENWELNLTCVSFHLNSVTIVIFLCAWQNGIKFEYVINIKIVQEVIDWFIPNVAQSLL